MLILGTLGELLPLAKSLRDSGRIPRRPFLGPDTVNKPLNSITVLPDRYWWQHTPPDFAGGYRLPEQSAYVREQLGLAA